MIKKSGIGNIIDDTAQISEDIILGNYNYIGKNVVISGTRNKKAEVVIGDCNYIHDNTRILIGEEGLIMGDWNVLHNNILILGEKRLEMGHNCWVGQNTIIDSSGGLSIGSGVRIGMYSQIWTHVASGELIEGCTLFSERKTFIEDEVWLVGSCIVASGLTLGYRSTCLISSNLTKDTLPLGVYGGNPAKLLEKLIFWRDINIEEKFQMMENWVKEFCIKNKYKSNINRDSLIIEINDDNSESKIVIGVGLEYNVENTKISYFDLKSKKYTKRLNNLERKFYQYIFGHKARFIPI